MSKRGLDAVSHWPLHILLGIMVIITVYPLLWVFTVAFSGQQGLAIVQTPQDPTVLDRLRAITPWPEHVTWSNFTAVFSDQPLRGGSATAWSWQAPRRCSASSWRARRPTPSRASAFPAGAPG